MMTTSTFSTTIENDNGIEMIEEEPTAEPEDILRLDYSNAMTEITRRILSTEIDGDEDRFNDTDTNTDNDGPINLVDEEELYWKSAKITTNTIISVLNYHYKETVEGAEMIQKILSRLEERCDSSSKGSGSSDTYDNINDKKFAYRLHCGHYTIALNAWSKSGHPASAQRATEMVHRMKERNIELNAVTYNSWMNAYVIQNNISKVEEILQIMEEHMIDEMRVKDYNVLILANARQGRAMEAEQIVKRMVDMYSEGKSTILPDLISYSMLLDAWSKSDEVGRGERAETILDSIEERQISFDTSAYENPESTISATYVAAMRAVIRSGEDNIVERVEKIRQRAAERGVVPDSYVYATLLDAYATTHPSDASVRVEEILKLMEDNIDTVDSVGQTVVYNTALKLLRESPGQDAITKAEEVSQYISIIMMIDFHFVPLSNDRKMIMILIFNITSNTFLIDRVYRCSISPRCRCCFRSEILAFFVVFFSLSLLLLYIQFFVR
ncbi:MAG: pentatricopeptide repeat protein [Bacillariaceae sp.]|jgi:pentatricopeptide repeat protein